MRLGRQEVSVHVAVIIVGYRNPEDILRCLDALAASVHADFEVIICENGGQEAFAALASALPSAMAGGQNVRVLNAQRNLGYAGGVNVCLRETPTAGAWWILNPDTRPFPDALAAMVDRLSVGDCEAVGCSLQLPDGSVQSYGGLWRPWLARAVSLGHGDDLANRPDPARIEATQNYLSGASMLIGSRFLDIVGPMREEYFLYCEEVEWCLRGRTKGMCLGFAPNAVVLHYQGTSTGYVTDLHERGRLPVFLSARNQILITRDCFPHRMPIAAVAALVLLFLRYGRRGAWRQLGYGLAGFWAGLRDLRGPPDWIDA